MENNKEDNIENSIFSGPSDLDDSLESSMFDEPVVSEGKNIAETSKEEPKKEEIKNNKEEDISNKTENENKVSKENSIPQGDTPKKEVLQENIAEETKNETGALGVIEESPGEKIESGANNELVTVRPVKFKEFEATPPNRTIKKNYDIMQDVHMHVSVELGRTKSSIKEVIDLAQGSIIELDKIAGEQVEIYVNDRIVAKGEVIVIEDRFGVRVTSTNLQKNTTNL